MNETGYPHLHLHLAKGIGPAAIRKVLIRLNQTGTTLEDFLHLPAGEQVAQFGLGQRQAQALDDARAEVDAALVELEHRKVTLLPRTAAEYPSLLKQRLGDQAPSLLYAWGNLQLLEETRVGFCGSRNASEAGLAVAADCAEQITNLDKVVVSGGARGVDTKVHRTALENGGGTIFVIPEGILRYRFRSDIRPLIDAANTLLISEFPPYMNWSVANAMQRNRTVCGLSGALIVIEAGSSGGTIAAGRLALRLGMPLFIVDYAKPTDSAAGNTYLLERGGHALRRNTATGRANLEPLWRAVTSPPLLTVPATQNRLF